MAEEPFADKFPGFNNNCNKQCSSIVPSFLCTGKMKRHNDYVLQLMMNGKPGTHNHIIMLLYIKPCTPVSHRSVVNLV